MAIKPWDYPIQNPLYCDVKDWQYKSSAEFKHCELVILLWVLEPSRRAGLLTVQADWGSCIFWRDKMTLPLTILTIIHSVSVPMPPATTCWAPVQSCSMSIQWLLYQLLQLKIKSAVPSKWQKSPCQATLQVNWLFGFLRGILPVAC